ncbi:MAG TPA: response regulator transcription factor [Salinivirgaceae bacterium]|nr:response regulator transcription factor [Salinivirgaceae bacterium]
MKHTHIIILDDAPVIREGLKSILDSLRNVHEVTTVSTFDELTHLLKHKDYQMVLINPHYLHSHQNQLQQLRSQHSNIKWIGVQYTVFPEELIGKLDGMVDVFDNQDTLFAKLNKWLDDNPNETSQNKESLTARETDVLRLLAMGKSNKEIADELKISTNTVITHRKNISQKTGIKSVSGLTIYAVTQNLISLDDY